MQEGRNKPVPNRISRGFTLIELIVVIVILGVLAATALPKFLNMSKEANIAALSGLEAAIRSADGLVYSGCAAQVSNCSVSKAWAGVNAGTQVNIGGNVVYVHYGRPLPGSGGLENALNFSGFTKSFVGYTAEFSKNGAKDPANCKVVYAGITTLGAYPVITQVTTGC